jgi:hypothetical protein
MTAENIHVVNNGPAWQNREMKQEKHQAQDHGVNGKAGMHGKGKGGMHNTVQGGTQDGTQGVTLQGREF